MRILLVDDDPAVRSALARLLTLRHEVRTAASYDEALAALDGDPRIDVVVCDVVMPERTGLDVLTTVRTRWPNLVGRFLLITGGAISREIDAQLEAAAVPVLRKPFSFAELEAAIAQLIAN